MFRKYTSRIYYALLLMPLLFISALTMLLSGCSKENDEPEQQPKTEVQSVEETIDTRAIVFSTDSDEWMVQIFKEHLLYSEAAAVTLPAPWNLPDREEARVLKNITYTTQSGERFITSDGYTFGMPSASVTKAGAKTKYSVLGLYIRQTTINVPF